MIIQYHRPCRKCGCSDYYYDEKKQLLKGCVSCKKRMAKDRYNKMKEALKKMEELENNGGDSVL